MLKKIVIGGVVICLSLMFSGNLSIKKELNNKYKIELPTLDELIDKENKEIKKKNKIEEVKKEVQKKRDRKNKTVSRGIYKRISKSNTSMKSYMDYRAIKDKTSEQYKLQHSKDIYTDNEGFRRIGDNFIIAVGTYFGCNVGQEVMVKLSSGTTFKAIVGDIKANQHTDNINIQHSVDGSVVEFLVDSSKLDETIKAMGDCSYSSVNDFKGDVVGITVYE